MGCWPGQDRPGGHRFRNWRNSAVPMLAPRPATTPERAAMSIHHRPRGARIAHPARPCKATRISGAERWHLVIGLTRMASPAQSVFMASFPAFAFLALLLGGTAIGFAGIFMRLSDVSPLASAFWRMALAAPILWAWAFAVRKQDESVNTRTDVTAALALAGVFFAGDIGLWHLSLHYTTVSNATLLSNLAPIFIALWMWTAHRVRFAHTFVLGLAIALVGADAARRAETRRPVNAPARRNCSEMASVWRVPSSTPPINLSSRMRAASTRPLV